MIGLMVSVLALLSYILSVSLLIKRISELEQQLRLNISIMERMLKVEQAARNLLVVLTPEGEVEQLAAQKLADLLGPEAGANV